MRIAFRVDASNRIGTGHFIRCITLAKALKNSGAQIRFVSRKLPDYLKDMLLSQGYEFMRLQSIASDSVPLDLAHAHWLGTSQDIDAQCTVKALSDQTWDWLIVDHYSLDVRWEHTLRQVAKNIFVIDDIADRQHDCDVLLDQNFYGKMDTRYIGKVPVHCRLLLGPHYALLRDEFRQLREQAELRTGPINRVLVSFGGVDADNYTGSAIEALSNLGLEELHVDVVVGMLNPHRKQIELACASHQFNFHFQTNRMAELMVAADLAIGGGGSTIWESCCLGLPTLAICTADNQVMQVAGAASEGFLYAPELKGDMVQAIIRHLRALLENNHLRRAMSCDAMQAADGRGVLRVLRVLGCSAIKIRVVCRDDMERLFEWRNHPSIRATSRNHEIINWEDHQKWFVATLASPNSSLLIGVRGGVPVGVVRFDIQDNLAEVSLYVVPYIKESGLGCDLLLSAERWFFDNQPGIVKIRAQVLARNERSHRLFLGAGYQVDSTCYSKGLHQND